MDSKRTNSTAKPNKRNYAQLNNPETIALMPIPCSAAATTPIIEFKSNTPAQLISKPLSSIRIDPSTASTPLTSTRPRIARKKKIHRPIPIAPISTLFEMNSHQHLVLSNSHVFTNYLGPNAAESKMSNADNLALTSKNYLASEKDLKEELAFIIFNHQREFRYHTRETLEEIRKFNIQKEHQLKLFYEKLASPIKYYGFKLEATPTISETRFYNYKARYNIQQDLELISNEAYYSRLFQSFSSIVTLSIFTTIISKILDLSDSPRYSQYATVIPSGIVILIAIFLTWAREKYLNSTIKKICKKLEKIMITEEKHPFDFADLKVALLSTTAIRMAAENASMEYSKNHQHRLFSRRQQNSVFQNKSLESADCSAEDKSDSTSESKTSLTR